MRGTQGKWVAALTLVFLVGCGKKQDPSLPNVPTLPRFRPGIYADIDPRWSHDGSRIAFIRATPDRKLQLHIVDMELDRPLALLEAELVSPDRPYSPQLRNYCSPDTLSWSPDDRKIAFERIEWFTFENGERLPGTSLWAFDTYSGRVTPMALHPAHYTSLFYYYHMPQWSPDGRYLAFVAEGMNGQRRICVHPLQGQRPQQVTPLFDAYDDSDWPVWRPMIRHEKAGGNLPALAYRQCIRRSKNCPPTETLVTLSPANTATQSSTRLWRLPARQYEAVSGDHLQRGESVSPRIGHLSWSPDGSSLAFSLTRNANDYNCYEVWVLRKDGSPARRVSPADGYGYFAPVWIDDRMLGALSPKGDRYRVVTIDSDSKQVHELGTIQSADCDWSPDRSRIVYAEPRSDVPPNPDTPTTLRIFETGLKE